MDTNSTIRTSDLYEAAYYLSEGFPPESVICHRVNKEIHSDFYFRGKGLDELQISFLTNKATVNLLLFRRCYAEAVNYVNNAKRDFRHEEKKSFSGSDNSQRTVSS